MTSQEYWDVEVNAGVVRTMTLDELDAAYQNGLVHEQTRVKENGSFAWSTLAIVAGIEDASPPSQVHGPHSLSPQVLAAEPMPHHAFLPDAKRDLDDELSPDAFRSRKKPIAIAFGVAAMALIGAGVGGFGASKMNASALPAAAAAPPPEVTPLPAPVETTIEKRTLSDDQKRALLEADQKRVAESEKKRAKSAPASKGTSRTKKDGLLKAGDKFDPLNGAL